MPKKSSRESASAEPPDAVELGYVSGVFGVHGEIRVFLHHRESDLWSNPQPVQLVQADGSRTERVLTVRPGAGKRVLGRIEGCTDRDAAARWQGARIFISTERLPSLEDGEYFLWQLQGAAVEIEGEKVGRVVAVHPSGPVEVLEVAVGRQTVFVPSLQEYVLEVDLPQRRVVLAPGALDEEDDDDDDDDAPDSGGS